MNIIETGVAQPKPRIHRTVVKGLFEKPTMMNNVETFYDICRILDEDYDNCRFSGIFGDGIEKKFAGRHKIEENIYDILKNNGIELDENYFVQIGGSASGPVYNINQLKDIIMTGAGSIEIFDKRKRNFLDFIQRLGVFYAKESCGKCKGKEFSTNLNELIKTFKTETEAIENIDNMLSFINDMNKKTFCKLCKSLKTPFITYCKNILNITNIE